MSFREKLLDFKRRLSDRKMYSIVVVVIAAVAIWGIMQYKNGAQLRQQLDNQYNRAFYDMTGYVNNVEVLLVKALIASTPSKAAATLQEAWRQANMAQSNLGQLPVDQHVLANTAKYLTQVGDLAYSLNNQNMSGKQLTDEQYKTIEKLYGYSTALRQSLNDLQAQITAGRIKWGDLANKGTSIFRKTSSNLTMEQFENIDKTFQEYPTLIYDGPFSDHMTSAKPEGVTGDELNEEQAKKKITEFFGTDRIKSVEMTSANDIDPIKTYSFKVTLKDAPEEAFALIDITQKGGHPFWMIYNRPVADKKINVDQAKALGKKFLEERGYKNMVDTYYLSHDNTATINYAYQQENVTIYPDLIKLKIALDTGEVVGLEAKGYLYSHRERDIPEPKISMEKARSAISSRVNILSSGLAIIPTNYRTEIFVYEFKGKLNDQDFLVYVNADNGKEEDILMIINTPNGILTM